MRTRKTSILIVALALAAVALVAPFALVANGNAGHLRLDGTWIGKTDDGTVAVVSFIPTDPSNNSGSFTASIVNFDGTLGGIFPDLSLLQGLPGRGDITRTGPRTFEYAYIVHGRTESREIVDIVTVAGTVELLDADNYEDHAMIHFFSAREQTSPVLGDLPDQDADGDGLPDPGQAPLLSVPTRFVAQRLAAALR